MANAKSCVTFCFVARFINLLGSHYLNPHQSLTNLSYVLTRVIEVLRFNYHQFMACFSSFYTKEG